VGKESTEMFEPLRFLHVTDVHLDCALQDVGPVSGPVQSIAHEGTRAAFDRMIAGAIEQKVDFVLLTGNTFRDSHRSLRTRLRLLKKLEELHDRGIEVFVLPGQDDPESAWRKIPELPGNVTLLTSDQANENEEEPDLAVAVVRDGRVIATITFGPLDELSAAYVVPDSLEHSEDSNVGPPPSTNGHSRIAPFRVGLISAWPTEPNPHPQDSTELIDRLSACHCDYLAVPASDHMARAMGWCFDAGQTRNTQDGIAHNPGPLQPLDSHATGPHGATLIEVDRDGEIRGTFLPFASLRRLQFEVPVEPESGLEDLSEAMLLQLENETVQAGEQAWLITWKLHGCGELFDSLSDPEMRDLLIETLPQSLPENEGVLVEHQFQLNKSPLPYGHDEAISDLERLYREALEATISEDTSALKPVLGKVLADVEQLENSNWRDRLLPLIPELDSQRIYAKAYALGNEWFRSSPDED
ncbi:MAG: metallophosphoesterase, partial [Planctomycetaceae bacterium]|nr:metallophosphoesterase [Planctomycetaceae bacterium]